MGDEQSLLVVLFTCTLGGVITGLVILYVFGALLQWSGRWLGGKSTMAETRAAFAWPSLLLGFQLVLWIPQLLIFGNELFTSETPRLDSSPALLLTLLPFELMGLVLNTWYAVVLIKCVAEAHQFSAWRSLGSLILTVVLFLSPFFLIDVVT